MPRYCIALTKSFAAGNCPSSRAFCSRLGVGFSVRCSDMRLSRDQLCDQAKECGRRAVRTHAGKAASVQASIDSASPIFNGNATVIICTCALIRPTSASARSTSSNIPVIGQRQTQSGREYRRTGTYQFFRGGAASDPCARRMRLEAIRKDQDQLTVSPRAKNSNPASSWASTRRIPESA